MALIELEKLVKELKQGSNYMKEDSKVCGYYHYNNVKFIFKKNYVEILREYGFDGEEDFSSIDSTIKWRCKIPKKVIDKSLLELVTTGKTTIKKVKINENDEGRLPYSDRIWATRKYKTDLEIILEKDKKPIIRINNPKERGVHDLEGIYGYI
ncbi:hypothetical protein A3K82_01655 [Candidatus Pacearchaeota archaeon RBG_19FT_COMBO_34_9]|nr:MAG: hypothetical protein A3K82_01655 [Candidatus Pacearchaeota archaeon RBG_19FT_COMBO_34_9]OGJ16757.1 MAG: hypothetical protein A3K74_00895 [Candidatus Pacearchaeota archaeon RBG_13_33_26]